ncbi:hypothetical protein [Streptococcus uberis]|uniref:hypothetical protein n=1 Tax=Streptococcus uberis TaxID=1349 RepID=UPI000543084E|nr:hypothetical protein [Streptococcus uberis]KHD40510.1 membrane protein [Streptococcus hongkongensis]KKF40699.1 membrane protein [Streptococcus uberis C9359]KKF41138.1 membrane protein [Streptococcus uberis EF20/0145]KKF51554.1 membrane protein [Streptococcus uberis C5388]KKF51993.1 membrane protein [Streptococcus uberis B190]
MISYEKVRQSLKTLNIVIIVLNSLLAVFSIFGIVSILLVMNNEKAVAAMGSEAAAILEQSMTPFSLFVSAVAIALTIAIIVFTVINQSKLKQNQELSYLPYFLGFGIVALNVITQLLTAPSLLAILIQVAFLALYFFAFKKAKSLNEKEQNIIEE